MASASKYQTIAEGVLQGVGGPENVASVTHCATRLRFQLRDRDKADKAAVEGTAGVITVVEAGGQFQVVIGNTVANVYEALTEGTGVGGGSAQEAPAVKGGVFARLIDLITSIFTPFLWVLAGTGLLKALLMVVVKLSPGFDATSTYAILYAAGDAVFQFLPIMLAITAAKRFRANQFTAVATACALIYTATIAVIPDADGVSVTLKALSDAGGSLTFAGIPVVMISYLSSVLPIILAVWVQGHLERLLQRVLPDSLRNFLTPMIVVALIVPFTLLLIGPVSDLIGSGLSSGVNAVWSISPVVGGLIMGAFWQVFVIFGVHWGFVPVMLQDISTQGYSYITGALFAAVLAQAGATLGVFFKTRNKALRQVSGPAALSGFLAGITEPAIYGVTLRLKRPFIYGCIGGGVGGAIAAAGHSAAEGFVVPGGLTLAATLNVGSFAMQLLGCGVAVTIAFVLTMTLGFTDIPETTAPATDATGAGTPAAPAPVGSGPAGSATSAGTAGGTGTLVETRVTEVRSPVVGSSVPLTSVGDAVFASGALGQGVGVLPSAGRAFAPIDGEVVTVMPHAYGLRSSAGVEVLVHLGIDTVRMEGKGFSSAVVPGADVRAGDLLGEFDIDAVRAAGFDPTAIVVVTSTDAHTQVVVAPTGPVDTDSVLLSVVS
ncbi:MAG TPA: beta-glucoside-specific PTS transporter subunit IIABC [Cellulomonas sp.]